MFLSRLTLDPEAPTRERYWELFAGAYRMHQEAWRTLGAGPEAKRDFLYRLEANGRRPTLYALAPRPARDPDGFWLVESKPFDPALRRGDRLAFDVRVNPVVNRDGKRHDVVMDAKRKRRGEGTTLGASSSVELAHEAVSSWFRVRGENHGYRPCALSVDGYHVQEIPRPVGGRAPRLATVELRGALEVIDPDRFLALVRTGLGPAKAFGCGLILLRRL